MKNLILHFAFIFLLSTQLLAQTIMNIHQSNGTVLQIPINTIDSITYTNPNPGNLPSITTTAISSITGSGAVSGGNISNNGGSLVTHRGVCWSTNPNPTTADSTTLDGSGTGSFTSTLTNLIANTTYYVRAYAINSAGTAYGNELSFTAGAAGGIVSNPGPGVSFDGYTYPSIILGNGQEWMAENLRTTRYANGDPIPNITDDTQWSNLTSGAWCYYLNSVAYQTPYGKLYNRYAVDDTRNVCPAGWRVPTTSDWSSLILYLDPLAPIWGFAASGIAGGKLKSTGLTYWRSPNMDATDEIGFSGHPGGIRGPYGNFVGVNDHGLWWRSTNLTDGIDSNLTYIYAFGTYYGNGILENSNSYLGSGLSIRCLKNNSNTLPTINTDTISSISGLSAFGGGSISNSGGSPVTQRGVCWSTSRNPTLANNFSTDGSGVGTFTSTLSNLTGNTTYYVRAYATNSAGTSYGNEMRFRSSPCLGGICIGDSYQGGIIACFLEPGDSGFDPNVAHGFIIVPNDIDSTGFGAPWGCDSTLMNSSSATIGSGQFNTSQIISNCSQSGIAASLCDNLVLNGYSDWYLPSKAELERIMRDYLIYNYNGNYNNTYYWSSTEVDAYYAWIISSQDASASTTGKRQYCGVRAIRAF